MPTIITGALASDVVLDTNQMPDNDAEADETPCAPSLQTRKRRCSAGPLTQSRGKRPRPCSLISPMVKAPNSTIPLPENPGLRV